jgi:hypothetical protein
VAYDARMEGVRKPGTGSLLDGGGGGARSAGVRSADATPGKHTLTMGLDAAQPVVRNGAPVTGVDAAAQMGPGRALDSAADEGG